MKGDTNTNLGIPLAGVAVPGGRYRFVIEGLLIGMQVVMGIIWISPAPLLSIMMEDLSLTRTVASLSISLVAIVVALASLPGGIIAAKLGAKRAILVGGLLMSTAILAAFLNTFPLYLGTRVLMGFGVSLIGPAVTALVMQWFPAKELPIANGLNLVAISLGNSLSLFTIVPIQTVLGWQNTIALTGCLAFGFTLIWLVLGRDRKVSAGERESHPLALSWQTAAQVLGNRATLLVGFSLAGPLALSTALTSWLPTYYNQVFHMPLAAASSLVGLFTLVGIPAALVGGFLPLLVGLRKPFLLFPGAIAGFIALGVFLTPNPLILYPAVVVLGICLWIYIPPTISLTMELPGMTPSLAGVIIATAFAMGNAAAFLSPLVVGWTADVTGSYIPGFLLWALLSWSLLISAFLPETGPRATHRATSKAHTL